MTKTKNKTKKRKWECNICRQTFTNKKLLVEHLKDEFEEADMISDMSRDQLEELGIDNPYSD
ncbi:MAG: hypothetical protein WC346_06830 [Methanogenium sp.]|jgi:hypothetical protein